MTTRITVTTGDGGLLERNAQQQAAARQAALVKAQAEQAAALGDEQLRKERIAQGRDPLTGRPLPSTGSTSGLTRINQEPAAFRSGGVLLVPSGIYQDFGGTYSGLYGKSSTWQRPVFSRLGYPGASVIIEYPEMEILSTGGPDGSPALRLQAVHPLNPLIPDPAASLGSTPAPYYKTYGPIEEWQELNYALISEQYDGLGSWADSPFSINNISIFYEALSLDGTAFTPTPAFGKNTKDYPDSTHEIMVKLNHENLAVEGAAMGGPTFPGNNVERDCFASIGFDGIGVFISATEVASYLGEFPFFDPARFPAQFTVAGWSIASKLQVTLAVTAEEGSVENPPDGGANSIRYVGSSNPTSPYYEPLLSDCAEEWVHIAVTRSNNKWSVYFKGQRLAVIDILETWNAGHGATALSGGITLRSFNENRSRRGVIKPAVHGYRFTPRVLYRGEQFTPPAKITRLA